MNITFEILENMSPAASFSRGEDYFERGLVLSIDEHNHKVVAKVLGDEIYLVKLWEGDGKLRHQCSCPMGVEGFFCKHCVAAGLAWLADQKIRKDSSSAINFDYIKEWLLQQEKDFLVDFLMEQLVEHENIVKKLTPKMAKSDEDETISIGEKED